MEETRPRIELNKATLGLGYKMCRASVNQFFKPNAWLFFKPYAWLASNLPGTRRRSLEALMSHLVRCIDLLDLESSNGLPLDVWQEIRDDVSDAFLDRCTSADLAALADTCIRFEIPKQYLFDMLEGVDTWIRNRQFATFDDVEVFAYRLGGASMAAIVPILGAVKPDFEIPAIKLGKAIFLTQMLAHAVNELKQNKNFFALQDIEETGLEIHRLKLRQSTKQLAHFVRLHAARIRNMFEQGAPLVHFMDFDGKRTISSLIAMHWTMLLNMQRDPDCILNPEKVLTRREAFGLRTRHLLGVERKASIIPAAPAQH